MSKPVHKWEEFRKDFQYIREVMRQCEALYRSGKWGELSETLNEVSCVAGTLMGFAADNFYGVEDSYANGFCEVSASDDVRKAEKWQAHRLELLARLERPAGDPFAVTSAEVSAALASHGIAETVERNDAARQAAEADRMREMMTR